MTSLTTDVFHYTLPSDSPSKYAEQALAILKTIEAKHSKFLPYMLASDVVLTLSGVRAFDTYLTFEKLTETEIDSAISLLADNGLTLFSHWSEYSSSDKNLYSLMHHAALKKIPEQYKLNAWIEPLQPFTFDRMLSWAHIVETGIFQNIENDILPKEWQNNHWGAHNIRFGILLGYPGEAIASCCWEEILHAPGDPLEATNATIAYHDAYDAAYPVYSFVKHLGSNEHIINHQLLWSEILTGVYESPWHKSLSR